MYRNRLFSLQGPVQVNGWIWRPLMVLSRTSQHDEWKRSQGLITGGMSNVIICFPGILNRCACLQG